MDISLLYHSAYTNQSSQNYNTSHLVTFMGYFYHGTWAGQRSIGKTLANGQTTNWQKNLWRISEIVSAGKTLGDRVGSKQANELHKSTITVTASRKLACA